MIKGEFIKIYYLFFILFDLSLLNSYVNYFFDDNNFYLFRIFICEDDDLNKFQEVHVSLFCGPSAVFYI